MNKSICCLKCGKELIPKEGRLQINPKRKFCNNICKTRYDSYKRYLKIKDTIEYKSSQKKIFKNWYEKNKERQKRNTLKDWNINRNRWNQRRFNSNHKKEILEYLNSICPICKNPIKIIMIKKFGEYPNFFSHRTLEEKESDKLKLEKYVKENLIGVCSKECMNKVRKSL